MKYAPCISLREKRARPHALYDGVGLFHFHHLHGPDEAIGGQSAEIDTR